MIESSTPPLLRRKSNHKKIISIALALPLIYTTSIVLLSYSAIGITNSNSFSWIACVFLSLVGRVTLGASALIAAIFAINSMIKANRINVIISFLAAILYAGLALKSDKIAQYFGRLSELQDLRMFDLSTLRGEASLLIAASKLKQYPERWFGGEVPPEDIPPNIKALSKRAAYVTASDDGVVLVTDGMGNWRAGYMITPKGSKLVPIRSINITEGVFYVTASGS